MKIYFAGAIRGGREKVNDYAKIVQELEKYGEVLTKHIADPNLSITGEDITPKEVYKRDVKWLEECDILFAEITVPSLGVGYELAYAESKNKRVICMFEKDKNISGFIRGDNNFIQIPYSNMEELIEKIHDIIKQI